MAVAVHENSPFLFLSAQVKIQPDYPFIKDRYSFTSEIWKFYLLNTKHTIVFIENNFIFLLHNLKMHDVSLDMVIIIVCVHTHITPLREILKNSALGFLRVFVLIRTSV